RRREISLILAFATVAGLTWAFIGQAEEVFKGDTEHFDRMIAGAMNVAVGTSRVHLGTHVPRPCARIPVRMHPVTEYSESLSCLPLICPSRTSRPSCNRYSFDI